MNVRGLSLYGNKCRLYDSTPLAAALCDLAGSDTSAAGALAAVTDPATTCGAAFCCGTRLPLPADPAAAVTAALKPLRAAAGNPLVRNVVTAHII